MLMCLGQFVFGINSLSYQQLQRQTNWRWASSNRVGQRPARQYAGPGDDTLTMSGWIAPELAGDRTSLDRLRVMGAAGEPYVLVDMTGTVFGLWVIEGISETGTLFRIDGKARRIEFSMTLNRVDDDQIDQLGLINSVQELLS